jgi:uncharacterized UBP type Zn finger protein
MTNYPCEDLDHAAGRSRAVEPSGHGCEECLASGGEWVHLRLCLTCGHVGCCDSSPGRHATQHFHETHHPVIRSFEPGEDWAYCFADEEYVQHFPAKSEDETAPEHYAPSP